MTLPFLRDFLLSLARQSPLAGALTALEQGAPVSIRGLTPAAQMLATVQIQRLSRRPAMLLVADNDAAEEWRDTLATFVELTRSRDRSAEQDRPLLLPAFDIDPYEGLTPHSSILEQQAVTLWRLAAGGAGADRSPFLIVPAVAAAMRWPAPEAARHLGQRLRAGEVLDPQGLIAHLTELGYQRTDPVEMPGQFSLRGGLLDVFSPEAPRPVRLEWFGDEIESLREFDPGTQRSVGAVQQTWLLPLTWPYQPGPEGFQHSIFDLLPGAVTLLAEPAAIEAEIERWWGQLRARHQAVRGGEAAEHAPPAPERLFFTPEAFAALRQAHAPVEMRELAIEGIDLSAEALEVRASVGGVARAEEAAALQIDAGTRPAPRFPSAVAAMIEELRHQLALGYRLLLLGANAGELERLGDLCTSYGLSFQFGVRRERSGDDYLSEKSFFSAEAPTVILAEGALGRGFSMPGQRCTILGSGDLFPADVPLRGVPVGPRRSSATFVGDFRDLAPGDYVVHVEHGIGQYLGLRHLDGEGTGMAAGREAAQEFMLLEYADAARLYVPLTRLDLVQKYRSADGVRPPLDRLGGTQWAQRKSRVKRAMKDMADELLKLYAARQAIAVPACPPDDHFQHEFADAFPFSETEDQQRAIDDVRRDLESTRPMDRLIVGDVGYGKTEVAMRAAFKIVAEHRQVAVLAPTTVLAFQHEQTFQRRFRAFPVEIAGLSRFQSRAQHKQTLERLAQGRVDIVIGTHRLLSQDVKFQNLGLLVIDEEQRFGVRHKERLKQLKQQVHVLTLSATPIPRTLNMALAGLRELSVIETPPRDRLAIQTVVAAWDEHLIAVALRQELSRGGQVYFVHNRVETIWDIAALLQRLAPEARLVVAHGQMDEKELEAAMMRFIRHECDVLVATTIIENGLDIPLANTLIVNRADRLGLSELYQLRGRVGRSNRRAYAYLLVPAEAELTPVARKRLAALREFSDLGAGFKIAALDLELRGGGNLLGGEQSGNLDAVGFDLYVQMLEQTVRELKGESVAAEFDSKIQLGLDLRLPPEYIPEENQRLRIYKRLAEADSESRRTDALRELRDRYGPPPAPVLNLLAYAALRPRCRDLGIQSLERRRGQLLLRFTPQSAVDPELLARLVERRPGAQFTPQGMLKLPFAATGATEVLTELEALLDSLQAPAPARR